MSFGRPAEHADERAPAIRPRVVGMDISDLPDVIFAALSIGVVMLGIASLLAWMTLAMPEVGDSH